LPAWDIPNILLHLSSSPAPGLHTGSPRFDKDDPILSDPGTPPPPLKPASAATRVSSGQKRKTLANTVADIAENERTNHHKIAELLSKEKIVRSTEHEKVKQDANIQLELAHLDHQ
jgi:hypothetical protein